MVRPAGESDHGPPEGPHIVRRIGSRVAGWRELSLQTVASIAILVALCTLIGALSFLGGRMMADTNARIISRQVAVAQFAAHHTDEELAEVERYLEDLAASGLPHTLQALGDRDLPRNSMIAALAVLGPEAQPVSGAAA